MKKKLVTIACLLFASLGCVACGETVAQDNYKPTVLPPEIIAGNNQTRDVLKLDDKGLFATAKSVSAIEYNKEIPETYKNLQQKGARN